jgi:hypothetical protein
MFPYPDQANSAARRRHLAGYYSFAADTMADSLRKLIMLNREDVLRNVVKESYLAGERAAANGAYPTLTLAATGTYTGVLPRKYTVEVISGTQIRFQDLTTPGSPVTVTPTTGVPFAIEATGISLTATFTGALPTGEKWTLRMNKCAATLPDVSLWQKNRDASAFPMGTLFDFSEVKEKRMVDAYYNTLQVVFELWLKEDSLADNEIRDLLGNVEDEWNRDYTCGGYAMESHITESRIFKTDAAPDLVGIHIIGEIMYRHAIASVSQAI